MKKCKLISIRKEEFAFYLSSFFLKIPSVLYSAVITAFLVQCGYSMTKIGTIWSITLFAETVLDFPTGGFADKYGRLKIFMIGMVMMGVARILYTFGGYSILTVYFAAFLMGAGESQVSGTITPWFISSLKEKNKSYIRKVFSTDTIISNILGVLTGFVFSLFHFNYSQALKYAGIIQIIGGFSLYMFFKDNKGSQSTVKNNLKQSLFQYAHNKNLILCTLLMCMLYSFYTVYLFVWQPAGKNFGIEGTKTGLINSLYLLSLSIGSWITKKDLISQKIHIISFVLLCMSIPIIVVSKYISVYILGIVMYGIGYGMVMPYISSQIQLCIGDTFRASLTSLVSSISSLVLVFIQIIIGKMIDVYGMHSILLFTLSIAIVSDIVLRKIENDTD